MFIRLFENVFVNANDVKHFIIFKREDDLYYARVFLSIDYIEGFGEINKKYGVVTEGKNTIEDLMVWMGIK